MCRVGGLRSYEAGTYCYECRGLSLSSDEGCGRIDATRLVTKNDDTDDLPTGSSSKFKVEEGTITEYHGEIDSL